MGCTSQQIQTTPYPLCEVLSGRICLVNGTQVSGPRCVCLASGLCLFSLHNGPQLSAVARPELIGSQWAGMEPPPTPHLLSPLTPLSLSLWDRG